MKTVEHGPERRPLLHLSHGIVLSLLVTTPAGCQPGESASQRDKSLRERSATTSAAADDVMPSVRSAIANGKLKDATTLLNQRLVANPADTESLFLLAQIAALRGQCIDAIAIAEGIDITHRRFGRQAGELVVQQAEIADQDERAISKLTALVKHYGFQSQWHHLLWNLLNRQGRRFEASQHAEVLCSMGQATLDESLSLIRRGHFFAVATKQSGSAQRSNLVESLAAFSRRDYVVAQRLLQSEFECSCFSGPAAAALYGRILAESEQYEQIPQWLDRCGQTAQSEPNFWAAVGAWLGSKHEYRAAIGATLAAIQGDSTDRVSYQRIASWLHAIDQRELGDQFWHRGLELSDAEALSGVDGAASIIKLDAPQTMRQLALQLLDLGRPFESMQWTLHAIDDADVRQRSMVSERLRQLRCNPQLAEVMRQHYRIGLDPAEYPFDESLTQALVKTTNRPSASAERLAPSRSAKPVFDEVAEQQGLTFTVIPKDPGDSSSLKMHEALGSGIAVIDFDLDGWPDLYLGQAGSSPPTLRSSLSDALFRNAAGRFVAVTPHAGVLDFNYTLGVSSGDVNQDGFPDLLIGNLGVNGLFVNNGDGTFVDRTEWLGSQRGKNYESLVKKVGKQDYLNGLFTTSVAIADIDRDHLPDLYTANYVELEDLFVPPKPDKHGRVYQKTPRASFAEADQCYFQTSQGSFKRQDIAASVAAPASSLGLVITDLDGHGGNEIFIGNDARPNHLLSWSQADGWSNRADVLGIANNAEGLSTACMGIAPADFDASGTIDLFITNFATEPACLYLQDDAGLFLDRQFRFGLDAATRPYVSFGCKTIDLGRDGWHDVAITNGHVDPAADGEFEMLPQCLVRRLDRFESVTPESNSNYWRTRHVGRTMATLDYDRDGLLDIVINHVSSPIALLKNRTPSTGSSIQLELVGTQSERDAIGAKVSVEADGIRRMQAVTAGDGYFCSDEAVMEISLGNVKRISSVEVHWPSGLLQKFDANVELDRRYLIVEGEQLHARAPQ